jgi:signal transduction histidine kinase
MRHLRLGTRITLWSSVVVALGILLCGTAITLFVRHEMVKELDRQLAAEGKSFLAEWRGHGGLKFDWTTQVREPLEWVPASEPPRLLEVVDAQERVLYRTKTFDRDLLKGQRPGFHYVKRGHDGLRVAVFSEQGITLRLAADLDPINDLTQDLATAFLLALPLILGLIFLGGRLIAHKAIRPIQEITESAERITAQRLDQRLPVPPVRDEIHRLATVLNGTLDRLDESFRQATRFSADASHELKTPLTVLRTSIEALLRSPELSSGHQQVVAGFLEQTKRLSSITASLLLLSRADAGKLQLDLSPGDLSEIINLCVEDARIIAEDRGIEIELNVPAEAWALVDRTRAAQIVMNLLDNALKYNHGGGRVRVTLAAEKGQWTLRIANTGAGIPPAALPHLFERFYRGEHTAAIGGHGLGLSLARELARAHGGDLQLASDESEWTAFVFALPTGQGRIRRPAGAGKG